MSAGRLPQVALLPGECLRQDRRFAIALAATRFDPARPEWLPKTNFAMLMRDEILAELQTRFDAESGVLTVERQGRALFQAPITNPAGRDRAALFFGDFLGECLEGPPRLVEAPGHTFAERGPFLSKPYEPSEVVKVVRSLASPDISKMRGASES